VDVAAERDDARLIEDDRRGRRADVERQLDLLGGREQ
jgi:hypothetical protein